jgi:iron(III) transport system permease protein
LAAHARGRPSGTITVLLTIAIAAAVLVLAPLVSLVGTGLSGGTSTLAALSRSVLPAALLETALLLTGVALVAGAIGAVTAWTVTEFKFPGSSLMAWLLPLPLALPTYVAAYIYVELLDAAGPIQSALRALGGWRARGEYLFPEVRSLPGCVLVMSLVLYPYVYVAMRAAFLARGPAAIDAARTLGAGTARVFVSVALPLARPALVAGITLVLLETMNDIGATEYLGVRTLTVSAYTAWLNRGDLPGAAQIALVALAVVAALVVAEQGSRGRARRAPGSSETRFATRIVLSGWPALAAFTVCALPILFGLVLPSRSSCSRWDGATSSTMSTLSSCASLPRPSASALPRPWP